MDTAVSNTDRDGIEFSHTEQTAIVQSTIENSRWNGIEFDNAKSTHIRNTTVINSGWDGIDVYNMRSTDMRFVVCVVGAGSTCLRRLCTPRPLHTSTMSDLTPYKSKFRT